MKRDPVLKNDFEGKRQGEKLGLRKSSRKRKCPDRYDPSKPFMFLKKRSGSGTSSSTSLPETGGPKRDLKLKKSSTTTGASTAKKTTKIVKKARRRSQSFSDTGSLNNYNPNEVLDYQPSEVMSTPIRSENTSEDDVTPAKKVKLTPIVEQMTLEKMAADKSSIPETDTIPIGRIN